jgi:Mg2+-importing ATPase
MEETQNNLKHYSITELQQVLQELDSSNKGLTNKEAKQRLKKFGSNVVAKEKRLHIILEFLLHFKNPLIIILLLATVISAALGETVNAAIIGIIIFFSVVLNFIEEHSANNAAQKLLESVKVNATVIRGGKQIEIRAADICLGDVIFLSSGDLVPADARIISAKDLFINQSALTGESFPAEKSDKQNHTDDCSLINLANIVFGGTSVVSGTATAVVIKTGQNTEFGKIAAALAENSPKSEFEVGIIRFGYFIMKIILSLVLVIFLFDSLLHHRLLESFIFAAAIAVGVTPELLPMIMAITMSRGSMQMAKKGVIIKRLAAIPNLGSMDILCTDKTGTITENKIVLVKYTDILANSNEDVLRYAYINSSFQTGVKNPLDKAVLEFKKISITEYHKIDEIPFDFVRKIMSIVAANQSERLLIAKGALEELINRCTNIKLNNEILELDTKLKEQVFTQYHKLSADGFRVIALAIKQLETIKPAYTKEDEHQLTLLGFIAFLDPPQKNVKEVLHGLHENGIEVKIITGDNELVAQKICAEVGLKIKGILLGQEIDELTDDALRVRVENTTLFARFSPDEKNRIIHALRANNHIVGYMGDGINDAPSLKSADVGISVFNAVDVARESADVILTKKSLSVLQDGIWEGRKTFGNTMKYIMMGLSSNFGNMFSVLGAVLFLPFLPMLPVQILLNNLLYDLAQITLPTDNVDKGWLQQPRRWNLKFVKRFMWVFGPTSSLFDYITYFVLFVVFKAQAGAFQTGWFLESIATQTLVIHIIRTRRLPFIQSTASKYLLFSTFSLLAVAWIIPYSFIGKYFGFVPLPINIILTIAAIVVAYLITVEVVKRIFYRFNEVN